MNNWIVDLNQKEQARGTALVFVPHAGGGPNAFRSVAREIRRKLPVYAICDYCSAFATPFHAPLLQRSMADCHTLTI